jgi:hypothetical protein
VVNATAHGDGYAIETAGTITNNSDTVELKADDGNYVAAANTNGSGTTTKSPNTPPSPPSNTQPLPEGGGGGCDAGFGSFAALFALGMLRITRRKRS